jgi:hypothetical protein
VLFMLRALCLALTFLVLPVGYASADAPADLGGNAALEYWQAFATLPKLTDADEKKLNAECLTMPLDAHAREMVANADYALRMLHHGAALPGCAWGVPYEDGLDVRLPRAQAARVLCSLACLRARIRFEEGKSAEAVDDLLDAMALSRHVSQDGILLIVLTGYSIERTPTETLAASLPRLDARAIKDLKTRLDALPPSGSLAAAMRYEEKSDLDWLVRRVKETKDKDSLLALLSPFFLTEGEAKGGDPAEKARAFLEECGGTAAGVVKLAEEVRAFYPQAAKLLDLPPDQFEKEFEREAMKRAGNPVFKMFFPALVNVRRAQARADVRRSLLAASLAVQVDGRDALKNHPDPVVGGPFEYVAFEGGFELHSKLKGGDDKPVALTVGRRGK